MRDSSSLSTRLVRASAIASIVGAFCTLAPAPARAHFILKQPEALSSQDFLGSPQKLAPCGDEGGGTLTGIITGFAPGETIAITIDETIFHPGHYRVALAVNDPSELPAEPVVTPGNTPCGSAPIMDPPVFPVLADGLLVHSSPFNGPQTVMVTLPSDITCTKCTLQIIEFMSNHGLNNPGGCYYHHCANIAISGGEQPDGGAGTGGGGTTTAAGTGGGSAATGTGGGSSSAGTGGDATGGDGSSAEGCSCSSAGGAGASYAGLAGGMALAALGLRRRKRR